MQLHLITVLISLKTCVKDYEDNNEEGFKMTVNHENLKF